MRRGFANLTCGTLKTLNHVTPTHTLPPVPVDLPGDELPLAGVRVIDVGNFLAGPFAATLMGEFGAEVHQGRASDRR